MTRYVWGIYDLFKNLCGSFCGSLSGSFCSSILNGYLENYNFTLRFNPFNFSPFALHSAEPGHLALGKLVDGDGELFSHLV